MIIPPDISEENSSDPEMATLQLILRSMAGSNDPEFSYTLICELVQKCHPEITEIEDIEDAADYFLAAAGIPSGQYCMTISQILAVYEKAWKEFPEAVKEEWNNLRKCEDLKPIFLQKDLAKALIENNHSKVEECFSTLKKLHILTKEDVEQKFLEQKDLAKALIENNYSKVEECFSTLKKKHVFTKGDVEQNFLEYICEVGTEEDLKYCFEKHIDFKTLSPILFDKLISICFKFDQLDHLSILRSLGIKRHSQISQLLNTIHYTNGEDNFFLFSSSNREKFKYVKLEFLIPIAEKLYCIRQLLFDYFLNGSVQYQIILISKINVHVKKQQKHAQLLKDNLFADYDKMLAEIICDFLFTDTLNDLLVALKLQQKQQKEARGIFNTLINMSDSDGHD